MERIIATRIGVVGNIFNEELSYVIIMENEMAGPGILNSV